jgi:hypothetical protein
MGATGSTEDTKQAQKPQFLVFEGSKSIAHRTPIISWVP